MKINPKRRYPLKPQDKPTLENIQKRTHLDSRWDHLIMKATESEHLTPELNKIKESLLSRPPKALHANEVYLLQLLMDLQEKKEPKPKKLREKKPK